MSTATLAHYAQYYGIRGSVAALRRLSFRRASAIGERIGVLGYRPFGIRRAVVERQVGAAFPGLTGPEVARIARASYASLGRTTIETALLPTYSREEVIELVERTDGWEHVEQALAQGRGLMVVTG